jgi:hypothetical protein
MPEESPGKVAQYTGLRNKASTLSNLISAILLTFTVLFD